MTCTCWRYLPASAATKPKDRLTPLLEAPDADELLNWLRRQPLMQVDEEKKLVMAHAGITPQWDLETAKQCARDVEAVLASDSYPFFLDAMYGDMPNHWSNELSGPGAPALYHQRLHPHALLLPERPVGYVQQRGAGRRARPTEAMVCHSGPCRSRVQYRLWPLGVVGRPRYAGRDLRAGYRLLLGGRSDLPALGR